MGNEDETCNIVRLGDYVGRRKKKRKVEPSVAVPDLDEATRDLHAVARSTMKFVYFARERLGLPPL